MGTFIRVKDDITGDEYDIDPASLRGGMTVLKDYPPNTGDGAQPRPPKMHVDKAGNRVLLNPPPPEPEAEATEPDEPETIAEPAMPADKTEE